MDTIAIFTAKYLYLASILLAAAFFFSRPRTIQKSMAICGMVIAPLSYALSRVAALLYYDPRPFVVGHFTPLIAHAADNGFPSDHVLLTAAIAMIILLYNKKLGILLWLFTFAIGWARVWTGVHHVADIAGSIAIVLVASAIYALVAQKYFHVQIH